MEVAMQLTKKNALEAHAIDELGILDFSAPQPFQAAFASFLCFIIFGSIPLITAIVVSYFSADSDNKRYIDIASLCVTALILLGGSGAFGAKIGQSSIWKGTVRVLIGGALALAITFLVGYISQFVLDAFGLEGEIISEGK
jgi:vacuolar iron transporter family protein